MEFRGRVQLSLFSSACILGAFLFASAATGSAQNSTKIETMQAWETCSTCAGEGGTGPATPHTVVYNVPSPSLDGSAAQFTNAGTAPFSDAIWWRQLGGNPNVSHFVYDLYFYINNPGASQALEFDINQSTGGRKYIWGTQCGVAWDKQWSVWGNGHWNPTGISCSVNSNAWNHLTIEADRSNGGVHFVAITLNGRKDYVNRTYAPIGSGVEEINVAVQLDQTAAHIPYSVWVNRASLNRW